MSSHQAMARCVEPDEYTTRELSLSEFTRQSLAEYFRTLDGQTPADLYDMVICEIERPLLEATLNYCGGNQSKASSILGINRGTLRKKLKHYGLE